MTFKGINWNEKIDEAVALGREGKTLKEIGDHFGVTRQRVQSVFKKFNINPEDIGVKVRTKRSRETQAKRYWLKWGDKDQVEYAQKRQKYRSKKANARRQGIEFWISFSEIDWPTHCPILGIKLDYDTEGRQENSVSFDRIDPSKGYVPGNVIVISWRANRLKNDGTWEEHKKIADFYKNFLQS